MAAPSINTVAVPTTMSTRGQYRFQRQRAGGITGAGVAVAAGPQMVQWTWSYMTAAEMAWWRTTIMSGALSLTLTAAELKDDLIADQTFTSGVLLRPTYESYSGGLFRGVAVTISHLLPILS